MPQERIARSLPVTRRVARNGERESRTLPQAGGSTDAKTLLWLQANAGNAAVSELLTTDGDLMIQRWGAAALPARAVAAALGPPTLKLGSKGAAVKTLQEELNAVGAALLVDSIFGPQVKTAVAAFQSDQGLKANGVVDAATHAALAAPKAGTPAAVGLGRYKPWESKIRWRALTKAERDDWTILGWNKADWDAHKPPASAKKAFKDLTAAERAAAVRLGYVRASWDKHWDVTASKTPGAYRAEEAAMRASAGKTKLPAGFIGSLRARAILDAEYGDLTSIKLPEVHLLSDAGMKKAYEAIYGVGTYPAGGLRGFQSGGIYLNKSAVWAGTTVHESLHKQEHGDWDSFAYPAGGKTSVGEGATTILTELALTNHKITVTTHSYPDEVALVNKMNAHSSLDKMKKAYFQGGANIASYRNDVTNGLIAGKTWAQFRALIDGGSLAGAKALLR